MIKVHISLRVRDLAASIRFYEAFFGQPPHKVRDQYANFDLESPPLKLALNETEHSGQGSLDHLGFVVESRDDVQAARDRLITAGLTAFSEEEVACCHATQDKVWATDPDGQAWEIYVLLEDFVPEGRPMTMLPGFRRDACCE